ncbi:MULTISPECIES: helix-turn-helix domain-containing protein [unclassified Tenacibaculum]|uniref:helix-turn-helix domain-containing protein n=1 Tax=unclassified Tenacibaculum TaxID=2635139 RepID=UPI001F30BF3A|nr:MULTISPECIES: helix-turn-helix domain-containing protein [unclassified Tenacibaculum]MCF2874318.1 helix-turn-helix domain-containing protein [Tenacibaculum sp. Cn5-1]MCF2934899.1 helix-turn-helix domain-containing protein [Tenacibaculum sp. Cn5-34]MCG7511109.1 helix-turn-helix domain-containing protein [Tenacibaculum sp. Cn5-46]
MLKKETYVVKNIAEILEVLNLSKYQKCEHFHIVRFKDHYHEMPHQISTKSNGIFEVTVSSGDETNIRVDGKDLDSFNDHLFFLAPGQTIDVDVQSDGIDPKGYMIFFTSEFLNFATSSFSVIQRFPFFSMNYSPMYFMNKKDGALFMGYMERIYKEFQNMNENTIEIIRSLLTIILFEAKRSLDENAFKNTISSRAEEITFNFETLLKNTKQTKRKLSYFADKLSISPIYLSECIKKTTGKSAKKLITDYIIMEAKSLLTHSLDTIDHIADHLGFDDTSNFINFFKKNTSKTPNQYRKLKLDR